MGKSTEPPKCRFCGESHRGTCMDHEAAGAISSQMSLAEAGMPKTPGLKKAAARVIEAIELSGGSSAVERRPSKPTVEGPTPSPRSKRMARRGPEAGPSTAQVEPEGTPARVRLPSSSPPVDTKPKRRGRPATGFDKKAYDRQKAAERRAKLKPTT